MVLPQRKRKKIGEMLIAEGLLTQEQLETALEEQRRHGGRIGAILKSLGFVTEEGIIKTLGRQTGFRIRSFPPSSSTPMWSSSSLN